MLLIRPADGVTSGYHLSVPPVPARCRVSTVTALRGAAKSFPFQAPRSLSHRVRQVGAGGWSWSGVREKYYYLTGSWRLELEWCEKKILEGWRPAEHGVCHPVALAATGLQRSHDASGGWLVRFCVLPATDPP